MPNRTADLSRWVWPDDVRAAVEDFYRENPEALLDNLTATLEQEIGALDFEDVRDVGEAFGVHEFVRLVRDGELGRLSADEAAARDAGGGGEFADITPIGDAAAALAAHLHGRGFGTVVLRTADGTATYREGAAESELWRAQLEFTLDGARLVLGGPPAVQGRRFAAARDGGGREIPTEENVSIDPVEPLNPRGPEHGWTPGSLRMLATVDGREAIVTTPALLRADFGVVQCSRGRKGTSHGCPCTSARACRCT